MGRLMSDTEIRHRKKIQGKVSQTTGTLGLASLGAFAASKAPGSKRLVKLVPKLAKLNPRKAENVALGTSAAAGGIGGAGAYNFAAYTNAESKKKKPVIKSMDLPTYGEEGIAKNWEPVSSKSDPEGQRKKRMENYHTGAKVGTGVLASAAAGTALHGHLKKKPNLKLSGKLAAGAVGGAGVSAYLKHKKHSDSWGTYSKAYDGPYD